MYVMLGLICSAVGCNWVPINTIGTYDSYVSCEESAAKVKRTTVMYFELRCARKEG